MNIEEVADNLGLSRPQARRRVKAVKDLVSEGSISRGKHNAILVSQEAFSVLKQLEEYHKAGDTVKEAKVKVREDLDLPSDPSNSALNGSGSGVEEALEAHLEEKEDLVRELKRDKRRLEEENEDLKQRLLPPPTGSRSNIFARFGKWLLGQ